LGEQRRDLVAKPAAEACNGVMVWMLVGGDETNRHGIIGRQFELAAR
jgi:hypothetical protein